MLDLAAGTGKLTRQLVARFARVIAVEPLDGMRAVLERVVPEAEALNGSADAIPLADDSVDAVFVGEAFHWFANDEVLTEIARVLRPRGVLAILFNQSDGDFEPTLPKAFWDAYHARAIEKPPEQRVSTGLWRTPFPGPFEPLTEASYPNPVELDRERRPCAGGVVEHGRRVAGAGADTAAHATRRSSCRTSIYRHPLRTELYWTRLR